jgi:hypothetical protein
VCANIRVPHPTDILWSHYGQPGHQLRLTTDCRICRKSKPEPDPAQRSTLGLFENASETFSCLRFYSVRLGGGNPASNDRLASVTIPRRERNRTDAEPSRGSEMSDERKNTVWLWIGVAALLPVLYLASFGPACWISSRSGLGDDVVSKAYQPIMDARFDSLPFINMAVAQYARLFSAKGWGWGKRFDVEYISGIKHVPGTMHWQWEPMSGKLWRLRHDDRAKFILKSTRILRRALLRPRWGRFAVRSPSSGGIALLNPRLIAATPLGVDAQHLRCRIANPSPTRAFR